MCWCPDLAPLPRFKHGVRCACARTRRGTRPKSLPEGKANSEALCLGDKEFAAGEQLSPWRDDLGWLSEPSTHPLVSSLVNRKQQGQQPSLSPVPNRDPQAGPGCSPRGPSHLSLPGTVLVSAPKAPLHEKFLSPRPAAPPAPHSLSPDSRSKSL